MKHILIILVFSLNTFLLKAQSVEFINYINTYKRVIDIGYFSDALFQNVNEIKDKKIKSQTSLYNKKMGYTPEFELFCNFLESEIYLSDSNYVFHEKYNYNKDGLLINHKDEFRQISFSYKDSTIKEIHSYLDDSTFVKTVVYFFENGYLVRKTVNGKVEIKYYYDEQKEFEKIVEYNTNGSIRTTYSFKISYQNNEKTIQKYKNDQLIGEYTYKNKKIIRKKTLNYGEWSTCFYFYYRNYDHPIKEFGISENNENIFEELTYILSETGKVIRELYFDRICFYIRNNKYNEKDLLSEKIGYEEYLDYFKFFHILKYKYEYYEK